MKKFSENEKGIIVILPVLLVLAFFVLGLTISSFKKATSLPVNVLSESSDSSLSQQTPEHTDVPEVKDTPEAETPEPKIENEVENETEFEVKEGSEAAKVKIKISSQAGEFRVRETEFQAESQFPLTVDKLTSQLTVNTPAGSKVVTILPDKAVQNMLAQGLLSQVLTNTQTGQNEIQLTVDSNGNLIYEINGVKFEKLLGVFNVAIDKTGQVSAQNGQIVGVNQSFLSRLLDLLSV